MQPTDDAHADPSTLKPLPRPAMFAIGVLAGFLGVIGLFFLVLISREASDRQDLIAPAAAVLDGEALSQSAGCVGCHSIDGSARVGPTWLGLLGSTAPDGSTVDEAYLRESIINPNASIAEGFNSGIMPSNYGSTLSDAEIDALVGYVAGFGT